MEYSQRRSKLEGKKFNEIVEQLNPDKEMGTKFKTIFDIAEEEGMKQGMEKGIAIGEAKVQDLKHQTIIRLIKTTSMENIQIAEIVDVPIALVQTIRLELSTKKA